MKSLLLATFMMAASRGLDFDSHRRLSEEEGAQQNLFAMEQKDMV